MKKVTLKDKTFRISIPYEELTKAFDQVAEKLNADFRGCEDVPVLLCVLNGSIMFISELMKRIDFNCQIVSTKLTSYVGTSSTGKVKQAMPCMKNSCPFARSWATPPSTAASVRI